MVQLYTKRKNIKLNNIDERNGKKHSFSRFINYLKLKRVNDNNPNDKNEENTKSIQTQSKFSLTRKIKMGLIRLKRKNIKHEFSPKAKNLVMQTNQINFDKDELKEFFVKKMLKSDREKEKSENELKTPFPIKTCPKYQQIYNNSVVIRHISTNHLSVFAVSPEIDTKLYSFYSKN